MNLFVRLVLGIFSVFRLSELFAIDDGPFEILINLRGWLANTTSFTKVSPLKKTIAEGLNCRHCNGVWFSFLIAPLILLNWKPTNFLLLVLGIAGAQSALINKFGRDT